jgi:hypothetical protein
MCIHYLHRIHPFTPFGTSLSMLGLYHLTSGSLVTSTLSQMTGFHCFYG